MRAPAALLPLGLCWALAAAGAGAPQLVPYRFVYVCVTAKRRMVTGVGSNPASYICPGKIAELLAHECGTPTPDSLPPLRYVVIVYCPVMILTPRLVG